MAKARAERLHLAFGRIIASDQKPLRLILGRNAKLKQPVPADRKVGRGDLRQMLLGRENLDIAAVVKDEAHAMDKRRCYRRVDQKPVAMHAF
jgi:hypothetical protein